MLLETLDIKKNDIVIFSQNIFDLENNFKIVFKDDVDKKIRKINYGDVCRFVNELTPKNLIAYRLLTNIKDFEIHLSKYGFFSYINDASELIYFDPIFAVKELEDYTGRMNEDLRFRIQQVGLTFLNRKGNIPNFAEIYSIDLKAMEAKYQNDRVFADAIFAKDKAYRSVILPKKDDGLQPLDEKQKKELIKKEIKDQNERSKSAPPPVEDEIPEEQISFIKHDISEDKDFDYKQIMRMNFKGRTQEEQKMPLLLKHEDERKSSFSKFLNTKVTTAREGKIDKTEKKMTNIFKSPEPLKDVVKEREDIKIVLKLNKK